MEVFSSWWGTKTPQKDVGIAIGNEKDESADATTTSTKAPDPSTETADQQQTEHDQNEEQPKKENETVGVDDTQQQPTEVPTNAGKTAKDWGHYLFNFAKEGTKVVTNTASILQKTVEDKTFMGDFNKEQEKFMKEKHSKRSEAAVAPWVGYNEEEQMKEHILALSKDKRNFMRNPPSGVKFHFDFDSSFPVAMAMLQEDPNLSKMRFELVPKSVTEEHFWRNYFYRVSLIKQSSQLTSLASAKGKQGNNGENGKQDGTSNVKDESTSESKTETSPPIAIESKSNDTEDDAFTDLPPDSPPANEFVSDAFSSVVDQADLQKGMEQLGMTDKEEPSPAGPVEEDVPEWEKELQQELQDFEVVDEAEGDVNDEWEDEINQMLEAEVEADQHKN